MSEANTKDIIPSEKECMELLKKHNVPENIVKHSVKVKQFALRIARRLKERGQKVDEKLVIAGALLHDLDKADTLQCNRWKHGMKAYEELKKLGMHSVAEVVRKHVLESILTGELKTIEEKIVYYADKRVRGDKIVSLKERFHYLAERYGLKDKEVMRIIEDSYEKVVELEKELLEWTEGKSL
ncbi:MAG: HDIG domain-containing protein [Candidatus Diapherotrites archaeon]|nr:HDIG domain-containing protein [Candidatus Diapherotrites archaeon]